MIGIPERAPRHEEDVSKGIDESRQEESVEKEKDVVREVYDELVDQPSEDVKLAMEHPGRVPKSLLWPFYVITRIYDTFGEETLRRVAPRLGRNMEIWDKFLEADRDVEKLVKNLEEE